MSGMAMRVVVGAVMSGDRCCAPWAHKAYRAFTSNRQAAARLVPVFASAPLEPVPILRGPL